MQVAFILAGRDCNLAAVAGQDNTLAGREAGIALFLHNHNGVAVIFTDFQLNALGFVHRALDALACDAARYCACCGGERTPGAAADGIAEETAQHCAAKRADDVVLIAALNFHRTHVNDGAVADILHLLGFRCGINVS